LLAAVVRATLGGPPAAPAIGLNADTGTVDRRVTDLGAVPPGKVASVVNTTNQSQRTVELSRPTAKDPEGC
jgi:hypothetical protein